MLSKTQLDGVAQNLVNLYNNLEREMLLNIAKRLSSKKELLEKDPEGYLMHQLSNLGMLDKQNLTTIKKAAGLTSNEINKVMYAVGVKGLDQTEAALKKAQKVGAGLVVPNPISESPIILNILRAFQRQAKDVMNLVNQTMLIKSKQIYTDVLNRSVLNVVSGKDSHDKALRKAVTEMAENGIPALVDKAGRKWGVEGYVRTVIISTAKNTMHAAQDARFEEYGVKFIEVTSHMGARPLCAPYQGRIFQLKGNDKYPNLYTETSYGQPAGLFGINCGHRKYPFIPGVNIQRYFPYDDEENSKSYKESQLQRAHERSIRKAKTQYEMHKAAGDEEGMKQADKLIKDRQAKIREFISKTGRTRRNYREQIHTNKTLPTDYKKTGDIETFIPKDPVPNKKTKTDIETPKEVMKPTPMPDPVIPDPAKKAKKKKAAKPIDDIVVGDNVSYTWGGQDHEGKVVQQMFNGDVFKIDNGVDIHITNKINIKGKVDNKKPKPIKGDDSLVVGGKRVRNLDSFKRIDSDHVDVKTDKEIFSKMQRADMSIVRKYTSNYYTTMNRHLRMNGSDSYVQDEINHLIKVLDNNAHEMKEDVILFRRFDADALQYIFDKDIVKELLRGRSNRDDNLEGQKNAKRMLIGGAIRDKAFISTTHAQGAFGSYKDVELEIYTPKGFNGGMFVESISEYRSEKEYLFNAGTDFEIIDIEFKESRIIFKVEPKSKKELKSGIKKPDKIKKILSSEEISKLSKAEIDKYFKDTFKTTFKSEGFSEKALPEVAANTNMVLERFPILTKMKKKLSIEVTDFPPSRKAMAVANETDRKIRMNSNLYGENADYAKESKKVAIATKSGWFVKGSSLSNTVVHELGHIMEYAINDKLKYKHPKTFSTSIKKQVLKNLNLNDSDLQGGLGKYATTNDLEFFAEAFTEYLMNPNPRPIAKEFGRLLEEKLKELDDK